MTSAQSRLQRSNGSSLLLLLVILFLAACSTQKGLKDGNTDVQKGHRIYNPKTGQYELVEDPKVLIDTVQWKEKEGAPDPIGTVAEAPTGKKDVYEITYLIPFEADGKVFGNSIDARTRRFLNYYGGVKLALEDLAREGINLNVNVVDSKESADTVISLLGKYQDSDLIVGPYERDALHYAASFSAEHQLPVISPWTPAIAPDEPSKYFVQIVPGLQSHAEAATQFVGREYPKARYFLISTPETREQTRMEIYQDAFEENMPDNAVLQTLVIDEASLSPDSNALTAMFDTALTHVYFMPFYLRSEEQFVNSFLRKVHAEHGTTQVAVIGLPQWMQFTSINPDYLESLSTHITAAQFVDNSEESVHEFNRRFYNVYGGVPEAAAHRGYELTMYLGHKLYEYGVGFLQDVIQEYDRGIRIRPVRSANIHAELPEISYLENKGIAILIFENQQFHRLE